MVSSVLSMGLMGIDAFLVTVESDISMGLPSFEIVGLPDASVKESRDRVRSALKNSGSVLSHRDCQQGKQAKQKGEKKP